jgi:hypothetical protein
MQQVEITNSGLRIIESNGPATVGRKARYKVSWQRVVMLGLMIAGGVACIALGQPMIGAGLIGAAAGNAVPGLPVEKNNGNGK